jgi:hypothetical protein
MEVDVWRLGGRTEGTWVIDKGRLEVVGGATATEFWVEVV